MGGIPDVIVIFDTNKEKIALQEAKMLNIPIVAIIDSNSNPDDINYPIPGNDDSVKVHFLSWQLLEWVLIEFYSNEKNKVSL
jgi:small subunit ribosomal protein S2